MVQVTKNEQPKMSWTNSIRYFAPTGPERRYV